MANWSGNAHIDSLLLGWKWSTSNLTYRFDTASGVWSTIEKAGLRNALQSWSNVANLRFSEVSSGGNLVEGHYRASAGDLGYHQTYVNYASSTIASYGGTLSGAFNLDGYGWDEGLATGGLSIGGLGYLTLVHEIGHALGLDHTHSDSGDPHAFPGVDLSPFTDRGDNLLNQDIYSVMSYVHGYSSKPLTGTAGGDNYGFVAGPMAFDIAAIQFLYGANTTYRSGADTYILPTTNAAGTYYTCIWDTGGIDTIVHNGTAAATIDLRAATLNNEVGGGGFLSRVNGIYGGFTIANGVVIENAFGGSGNDLILGNDWNNQLMGNDGRDTINGGGGHDLVAGGAGEDILNGGIGNDTMLGGADSDTYHVNSIGDVVMEGLNQGTDHVASTVSYTLRPDFENLTLAGAATTGVGNNLANIITGNSANNLLSGLAGADRLNGGIGSDTMRGGTGNDIFVLDNAGDIAVELFGEGIDTAFAYISYTARDNIENVTLLGAATDAGGNALNNILTGNALNNLLIGRGGNDVLKGGAGADTFVFDEPLGAANIDRIVDFEAVDDVIRLSSTIFGSASLGALSAGEFQIGMAALDSNDRIIYNTATGRLFFDADGAGGAAQIHFATLDTRPLNVSEADFVFI